MRARAPTGRPMRRATPTTSARSISAAMATAPAWGRTSEEDALGARESAPAAARLHPGGAPQLSPGRRARAPAFRQRQDRDGDGAPRGLIPASRPAVGL